MKRMKTVLVLLVICGVAACQSYIDFRKPMRLLYGGDTLIISLQGDSVIFSGKAAELVLRDSTLLEIIQAHGGTGGGGAGVVDTAGGQNTNMVPYWTDKNTLGGNLNFAYNPNTGQLIAHKAIYIKDSYSYINPWVANGVGNIANAFGTVYDYTGTARILSVKNYSIDKFYILDDSAVFKNYVSIYDSLYLKYLHLEGLHAGSVWYTNSPTGAVDSAATEPAYIGWEMEDLPTLEEYEKDVKMINGHIERRVWYVDYETKELKSQYGWAGLGMMNTQSAYMIYHEITVRWMFEQNRQARNQQRQIAGLVLLLIISLIVHAYMNRK